MVSRGRTSLVTMEDGEIHPDPATEGLYIYNTRVLSRYAWRLNGKTPQFSCSSNIDQSSWMAYFIQAPENCKETPTGECNPLQETLELRITRYVGEGMHEDIELTNHTQISTHAVLNLEFAIEFVALQEAEEGRKQHGNMTFEASQPEEQVWELMVHYHAAHDYSHQGDTGTATFDRGVRLRIENAGSAPEISHEAVTFQVALAPHQQWRACISWLGYVNGRMLPLSTRCMRARGSDWDDRRDAFFRDATSFSFSRTGDLSCAVQHLLSQSARDLEVLRLHDLEDETAGIPIAAGIPSYQEVFGRDMEASAWQATLLSPQFLRGSLDILNTRAATERNDWRDAQPGRMVHEIHSDPLSILNFRPQGLYFGSITSSPLFAIAVAGLWHWTGDLNAIRKYVDTAMRAIEWADKYSLDSTGFYRYKTVSEQGMKNQGWKDSSDAIVYPDGSQVDAPIGTCEIQAFMYAAKVTFSEVMFRLGEVRRAWELYQQAGELRARFNEKFWIEDEGYIAMGIDAKGNLIRSIAADPGHCLLSGIVDESRVKRVAARMMREDLFTGWGFRTLSSQHPAYNPFAYHRGSVWPVTTAAFAMAFSRYGLHGEMNQVAKALFEAAGLFEHHRLPEVFGGHQRTPDTPFPGLYTKADWPQAWSAGAPFMVIQGMLGISAYAPAHLLFVDPHLPEWLPEISVHELHVGTAVATIRFWRTDEGTTDYKVTELRGTLHVVRQPSPWSLTSGWAERIDDAIGSLLPGHRPG